MTAPAIAGAREPTGEREFRFLCLAWEATRTPRSRRLRWLANLCSRQPYARHVGDLWKSRALAATLAERLFAMLRAGFSADALLPPLPPRLAAAEAAAADGRAAAADALADIAPPASASLAADSEVVATAAMATLTRAWRSSPDREREQRTRSRSPQRADAGGWPREASYY